MDIHTYICIYIYLFTYMHIVYTYAFRNQKVPPHKQTERPGGMRGAFESAAPCDNRGAGHAEAPSSSPNSI